MRRVLAAVLVLACFLPARADEKTKALFRKCAPATVSIECKPNADGTTTIGSGVLVHADGLLVSNHHVIKSCLDKDQEVNVFLFDGRRFIGLVIAHSEELDLSLIRLQDSPGGLPALEWGDSDALEVGEDVIAIGNPDGLSWTLSTGIVSGKRESWIQTTAPINPGNSGGPLISPDGQILGINTLSKYQDRNNIAFSRAANVARKWVADSLAAATAPVAGPRFEDREHGFSITPPAGWELLDDNAENPGQKVAYQGDDSVLRVYALPGVQAIRDQLADQEKVLKEQMATYKRMEAGILTFRGREDAYALTYAFTWGGKEHVSRQITVNDRDLTWTLRFTTPKKKYLALRPTLDEVLYGARWPSEETGRETPERAVETWVAAIRARDAAAFLGCLDVPLWLDDASGGKYGALTAEEQAAAIERYRKAVEEMMQAGELTAQVEKGIRILAATVTGDRARVPLVSRSDDDKTVVEEITLARSDAGWRMIAVGAAQPYEAEDVGEGGRRGPQIDTFVPEDGSFAARVPADWTRSATPAGEGIMVYSFHPVSEGPPPAMIVVATGDMRGSEKRNALPAADLDALADEVVGGARGSYKAGFEVLSKEAVTFAGQEARVIRYSGRQDDFSREVEATLYVACKDGWLYAVTLVTRKGEAAAASFGGVLESFELKGKR